MTPEPIAPPAQQPNAGNAPSSDLNIPEIAAQTGYSESKIIADIRRTGATTREDLYPNFYGANREGIEPDAAAIGGGYEDEAAEPAPDNEMAEGESMAGEPPQRVAARDAMAGRRSMPQPQPAGSPPEEEESALGVGAEQRPAFNVHERARRMRGRQV